MTIFLDDINDFSTFGFLILELLFLKGLMLCGFTLEDVDIDYP